MRCFFRLLNVFLVFVLTGLLFAQKFPATSAAAQTTDYPNAYDLIAAVNAYRASSGLNTLETNGALMISAQGHSEYQASIGTWSHSGPGGSNEKDRAIAAGYAGSSVICDEAVAVASTSSATVDYIIYNLWNDYDHRDLVLLNSRYVHVGAGVYEQSGMVYYTLDVCVGGSGSGSVIVATSAATSSSITSTTSVQQATLAPTVDQQIQAVVTATSQPDGSIVHVVQPGQTMWSIAIAYGTTTLDLCTMNGISPSNPVVYVGEKLLVRHAYTATVSPTITQTPRPPTRTAFPTKSPRPTQPTFTLGPTPTGTPMPVLPSVPSLQTFDRRTLGIIIIIVCGIGLLAVLTLSKKDQSNSGPPQ